MSMSNHSAKKPLKIAFIGGGLSSAVGQVHYGAACMDGFWQLSAGAFSRDENTNKATAQQWGVPANRAYSDWRELILREKDKLDAVAVLLPTPQHAEAVQKLLQYNIPVICEKSLVTSIEELETLTSVFDANKHYLAVTYNYSGYPLVRELRTLIEQGELGNIKQFQFEMPQEGFVRPPMIAGRSAPPQSWRLQSTRIPMVCHDLGMHLHHLAYFLLQQEPEAVMADFSAYSPYHSIIDTASLWLKYADGMKGSVWFTKSALGNRNGMKLRVYGEKASAEWLQIRPEELVVSHQNGRKEIIDRGGCVNVANELRYNRMKPGHPAGFIEAFANLYRDIHHTCVSGDSSPYVYGLQHAAQGLFMFEAAARSHDAKRWQTIADVGASTCSIASISRPA